VISTGIDDEKKAQRGVFGAPLLVSGSMAGGFWVLHQAHLKMPEMLFGILPIWTWIGCLTWESLWTMELAEPGDSLRYITTALMKLVESDHGSSPVSPSVWMSARSSPITASKS
jgi:hypothetical protein